MIPQQQFAANVWAGIIGDLLLGPYELYSFCLNNYHNYWTVCHWKQQTLWVLHDDVPAHSSLTPANLCLWGNLKITVYVQQCNMQDELWNAIEAAGMMILQHF
jgi:hypothetical protein